MKVKHVVFFAIGALIPGTICGLLNASYAVDSYEANFWTVFPFMIAKWTLILLTCTLIARGLELWNNHYEGTSPELHSRKRYVGFGALSFFYLFGAFFWLNPIWAIIREYDPVYRINRAWEDFWKTRI